MRRRYPIMAAFILAALFAAVLQTPAQTLVTVTGQALDPNGIPYSGARLVVMLNNPGPGSPTLTPCRSSPCPVPLPSAITLDNEGNIPGGGIQLYANASILPAGTTYSFQVNENPGVLIPWGTGAQIFTLPNVTIGPSTPQSLTAGFTAVPPPVLTLFGSASGGGSAGKPNPADGLYYVTTEGSDSNDCLSWGTACATSQAAENKMIAASGGSGGTIFVGSGTFTDTLVIGTPTNLICNGSAVSTTYAPNAPAVSVISFNGYTGRVAYCGIVPSGQTAGGGIEVDGDASAVEIDHNEIVGTFGPGIYVPGGSSSLNIHDNFIEASGQGMANQAQIVYIEPANQTDFGMFIRDNILEGTSNSCILLFATSTTGSPNTKILTPNISDNSCTVGVGANYITEGVGLVADTSVGANEEIVQPVVSGNSVNGETISVPAVPSVNNISNIFTYTSGATTSVQSVTVAGTPIFAGDTSFQVFYTQNEAGNSDPVNIASLVDSLGDTWNPLAAFQVPFTHNFYQVWYGVIGTTQAIGNTFTITATITNPTEATNNVPTYMNVHGLGSLDQVLSALGTSANPTTAPMTITQTEFLLSNIWQFGTLSAQPVGWALQNSFGGGIGRSPVAWTAATILEPPGTYSDTWTGAAGSNGWAMEFASFLIGTTVPTSYGIYESGPISDGVVSSNTLGTLGANCVGLLNGVNTTTVNGNTCTGNGASSAAAGIAVTSSSHNIFNSNTLADFTGAGAGAIGIDITNSAATANCIGINIFTSITTPIADSGTSTGCPNSIASGGTLQSFVNKNLASNVAITASTLTPVDSVTVTMPSTGGPFRAQVNYTYFNNGGVNVECFVSDGTNSWGLWEQATTDNITDCAGSQWSPVTYANGAVVTFTIQEFNTGAATVETVGNLTGAVPSSMQVSVFASN